MYSHDLESACESPLEDFCRIGNQWADTQAEVANLTRPGWFGRIYRGYCQYRSLWLSRVKLYTLFVIDIARVDCQPAEVGDTDVCIDDQSLPYFEHLPNRALIAFAFSSFHGRNDFFQETHGPFFRKVFHRIIQWLSTIDSSSATSRLVSLFELYIGYRLMSGDGCPPVSGDQVVDKYSPVTFATDFSYFKQVTAFAFEAADIAFQGSINLVELDVYLHFPAIYIGWSSEIERQVFSAISSFVQRRPIKSTQCLSRPWQP